MSAEHEETAGAREVTALMAAGAAHGPWSLAAAWHLLQASGLLGRPELAAHLRYGDLSGLDGVSFPAAWITHDGWETIARTIDRKSMWRWPEPEPQEEAMVRLAASLTGGPPVDLLDLACEAGRSNPSHAARIAEAILIVTGANQYHQLTRSPASA
ncbi:hypothetical protein OG339_48835 (plasmid) [Streptosporangium sp. NBC_01495]|uniref:hypothetical protein n=1 Tax=Streptosporangium sp. NBC_01495 TaxID=2903899 RepID=UPI002E362C01|nr:hypothetical protein [Streptosporangium sp. NBC_01495]